ncbi:hypothetical protein MPSEU_000916400 [Mayamaea pseudoterrestris]|nr:hypothetical protein MPSEU_000916400 [Mayamaea pseudoterrestris]
MMAITNQESNPSIIKTQTIMAANSRLTCRTNIQVLVTALCVFHCVQGWSGSLQNHLRGPQEIHRLRLALNEAISNDDGAANTRPLQSKKADKKPKAMPITRRKQVRKTIQSWRIFGVEVHPDDLQLHANDKRTKQDSQAAFLHPSVLTSLSKRLKTTDYTNVRIVRRSLDARMKRRPDGTVGPRFVYVLDVDTKARLKQQPGRTELQPANITQQSVSSVDNLNAESLVNKRVIIVGAGPAGLFAALQLAKSGVKFILLERGQPVERRGRDIGALMHRRDLNIESNFCFGEGGAGTWSDGKLTTRIGRNSQTVRSVLETLVEFGAPSSILLEGAPHLGTDNLVRLLRNMRKHLRGLGGEIRFGTKMTNIIIKNGAVSGVAYESVPSGERGEIPFTHEVEAQGEIHGDAVILATGHSARDVYERLHDAGVQLEPKGFAVGFRIEHPQKIINKIQYGNEWGPSVVTGKVPTDVANAEYFAEPASDRSNHNGTLPVPSYRLATDDAFDGERNRGVYSFCMCPGGQIVPASTDPDEVCVNGMSFSRRDSQWANSALVVTVDANDSVLDEYKEPHGVLSGIAFQRDMERRAAVMGGGNLVVPVQRVTDFINEVASTSTPASSYRLGTKPAACHDIYPTCLTTALRHALVHRFDGQMDGYICDDAVLHAVETRTSSPVRIARDEVNLKAVGIANLFPAGEGAGFAGGIVSAAVDGISVGEAVIDSLTGNTRERDQLQRRQSTADSFY